MMKILVVSLLFLSSLAAAKSRVSLLADQFVSSASALEDKSYFAVRPRLDYESGRKFQFKTDLTGNFAVSNQGYEYVDLSEIHLTYGATSFGRKKAHWSRVDEDWRQGLIQPRFTFNPLRKSQQGLTGLFYDLSGEKTQLSLFASGLYIPDQGASNKIENGRFVGVNPWFQSPPESLIFQDVETPVVYNILIPETSDVVLQTSTMARLEHLPTRHLKLRATLGRKPMNQLALGFNGQLNTLTSKVEAEIIPQVVMHRVAAADIIYNTRDFGASFSAIADQPEDVTFDSKYTYQQFTPAQIYSPAVRANILTVDVKLSYYHRENGETNEIGSLAGSGSSILPGRFDYKRAVKLQGSRQFNSLGGKISLTNELEANSTHLASDVHFSFSKNLQIVAGFDLLVGPNDDATDVISSYRDSDRYYGGISYVF